MSDADARGAVDRAVAALVDLSAAMGREGRETLAPGVVADLVRIHGAALRLKRLLGLVMQDPAPLRELFSRSGVRHELNTPLNHVIGYGELLLEEALPPAFAQRLEQVTADAQTIFRAINGATEAPVAAAPAPAPQAVAPATDAGGGVVMIVDDDGEHRELLRRSLVNLGHATLEAGDGADALAALDARRPDVMLLDVHMPVLDGFQTLERLKDHPAWRELPVVVLSAVDDVASAVRCLQLGAEDYLHKPCNPVLLNARVAAALARKRLRDQELAYLNALADVTAAAVAMEMDVFEPSSLDAVAARPDALGHLARVFQRMAHEIQARQERARQLRDAGGPPGAGPPSSSTTV